MIRLKGFNFNYSLLAGPGQAWKWDFPRIRGENKSIKSKQKTGRRKSQQLKSSYRKKKLVSRLQAPSFAFALILYSFLDQSHSDLLIARRDRSELYLG